MNDPSPAPRRRWPQWWRVLGPVLLGAMLWRIGPRECWAALCGADLFWFLAACALSIPALAVKGYRWQEILRAMGYSIGYGESLRIYAAGSLAGAVTPGKVGDLAKAPLLAALGVPWSAGVAASLVDRALDAVVLLAIGAASLLVLPDFPGRTAIAVAACIGLSITLVAAGVFLGYLGKRLRGTGAGWWVMLGAATLAAMLPYYGSACCCARAVAFPVGVVEVAAGASAAAVLALLPVSVAGIGTRDAAFVLIFASRGVDASHSIALSSLILAWMVVNCFFFLVVSRCCGRSVQPLPVPASNNGATSHELAE